ncbi:MAG: DNA-protecting protein DprA [Candidatus Protochlamydia sp.]|nr:DNA-protecting protein DprA [Candidatus Protochlamydia sp.]
MLSEVTNFLDELESLIILTGIPLLGPIKIRLLLTHFGTAKRAIDAHLDEISILPGFGPKLLQSWETTLKEKKWKADLLLAEKLNAQFIPFTSPSYPKKLLNIDNFPPLITIQGDLKPQDNRSIAIVGTRNATFYGMEMAKKLGYEIAKAGFTIVSGLARGIDTAAHEGALEGGGRTIAVLGSGLAHLYPQENSRLASSISRQGAVMSEFPLLTPPDRTHFPRRNRIVSGLSLGTLLIEAPEKSGAMLTVGNALSQGRFVWALPGRADQENFKGNHLLIKQRKALLVENTYDVVQCLDSLLAPCSVEIKQSLQPSLEKEEVLFLQQLPSEELSIEEIIRHTRLPINQVSVLLMSLVLKKIVKEYPGKIFKKIALRKE